MYTLLQKCIDSFKAEKHLLHKNPGDDVLPGFVVPWTVLTPSLISFCPPLSVEARNTFRGPSDEYSAGLGWRTGAGLFCTSAGVFNDALGDTAVALASWKVSKTWGWEALVVLTSLSLAVENLRLAEPTAEEGPISTIFKQTKQSNTILIEENINWEIRFLKRAFCLLFCQCQLTFLYSGFWYY